MEPGTKETKEVARQAVEDQQRAAIAAVMTDKQSTVVSQQQRQRDQHQETTSVVTSHTAGKEYGTSPNAAPTSARFDEDWPVIAVDDNLVTLSANVTRLTTTFEQVQQQIGILRRRTETIKQVHETLRKTEMRVEERVSACEQKVSQIGELDTMVEELKGLSGPELEQRLSTVEGTTEQHTQSLSVHDTSLTILRRDVDALREDMSSVQKCLRNVFGNDDGASFLERIDRLEERQGSLTERVDTLTGDVDALRVAMDDVPNTIRREIDASGLPQRTQQLVEQNQALAKDLGNTVELCNGTRDNLEALSAEAEQTNKQLVDVQNTVQDQHGPQIGQLFTDKADREELAAKADQLELERKADKGDIIRFEQLVEELRQQVFEIETTTMETLDKGQKKVDKKLEFMSGWLLKKLKERDPDEGGTDGTDFGRKGYRCIVCDQPARNIRPVSPMRHDQARPGRVIHNADEAHQFPQEDGMIEEPLYVIKAGFRMPMRGPANIAVAGSGGGRAGTGGGPARPGQGPSQQSPGAATGNPMMPLRQGPGTTQRSRLARLVTSVPPDLAVQQQAALDKHFGLYADRGGPPGGHGGYGGRGGPDAGHGHRRRRPRSAHPTTGSRAHEHGANANFQQYVEHTHAQQQHHQQPPTHHHHQQQQHHQQNRGPETDMDGQHSYPAARWEGVPRASSQVGHRPSVERTLSSEQAAAAAYALDQQQPQEAFGHEAHHVPVIPPEAQHQMGGQGGTQFEGPDDVGREQYQSSTGERQGGRPVSAPLRRPA